MADRVATHGVVERTDAAVVVNCPTCRWVMWASGWCRGCLNDAEVVLHGPAVGGSVHHNRIRATGDDRLGEG